MVYPGYMTMRRREQLYHDWMCLTYHQWSGAVSPLLVHLQKEQWTNGATTIGEDMYIFDGGRCDGAGDCIHNDLYQLNTNDKVWRCIPCTNRPMKKHTCGFISYSYQGSDYILALGGRGGKQPPAEPQLHSLYTPNSYWLLLYQ